VIEIYSHSDTTWVYQPTGDLDMAQSFHFRHVVADILRPLVTIEIDLHRVDHFDAVGMSALIGTIRRANAVGGRAIITHAPPIVESFLRLLDGDRSTVTASPHPRAA
jgi:anti-anti-sigma factor